MNIDDEKRVFGQNILTLINQRNWSIRHAAAELSYDRQDLSDITVGRKNFKLGTAVKFARYFNVSVFMLFSRQFDNRDYRICFPFVDTDYMSVIRANFQTGSVLQAAVPLDPTTTSHIMKGRRKNLTINTLSKFLIGEAATLSELLKTDQDRLIEKQLLEDAE